MRSQDILYDPSSPALPTAHPRCLFRTPTSPGSGYPVTLLYYRIADMMNTCTILSSFLMNLAS
jgi:hypothetical protein